MGQMMHSQTTQSQDISTAYVVQVVPPGELEREALAMENLLQAFTLDEPFSLELCGDPAQQRFLLRAGSPEALETLSQQVLAQYPQAQLRPVSSKADPLILREGEHAVVGDFDLRAPAWMPIKTFWDKEMTQEGTDPVVGVLAAMEPVKAGERIISQIALVSAPDSWAAPYRRNTLETPLDKERQAANPNEMQLKDTLGQESSLLLIGGVVLLVGIQGYLWYQSRAWGWLALLVLLSLGVIGLLLWWRLRQKETLYDKQLVSEKLMRRPFFAQVRIVIIGSARRSERALLKHLSRLEVAYRQYDLTGSNGFELKNVWQIAADDAGVEQLSLPAYSFPYQSTISRLWHRGCSSTVLNVREVSGMWHLLQGQAEVPLVERLGTRRILASPEIFRRIQKEPSRFPPALAGHSVHRGYSVPIHLPESALFSHKFVVAKSGYGKSTLMQLLLRGAMEPIQHPNFLQPGVVAIDPHGDLVGDLLRQIPESRINDVVLIDLSDEEYPVGINLLDATMGFSSDQAVANAMSSFARIWRDSWGPRLAYILKNTLRSLYLANEQLVAQGQKERQYTLLDVNAMLQQPKYARKILAGLDKENMQHQKVQSFWSDYYFKLPPNMQQEAISPVSNKMGIFSDNRVLERIVGQPITTINVGSAVQLGKIILVNLASGRLEFDAAAIIGATVLNLVHRIMQQQATVPLSDRRQVFIAVDEFQNIPGADYEALLSEDRKYGGSLMLATQSLIRLEQMKEGLEAMTFSNCAQLFVFATSAEDAEKLEKELHSVVTVPNILNQPRLTCYAKLALPDQPLQIFSMQLAKPLGWKKTRAHDEMAEAIRASCRKLQPAAAEVDQLLIANSKRLLEVSAANVPNPPKANGQQNKQPAQPNQAKGQPEKGQKAPQAGNQPKGQNQPKEEQKPGQPGGKNQPNEKPDSQPNQPKGQKPVPQAEVQDQAHGKPNQGAPQAKEQAQPDEKLSVSANQAKGQPDREQKPSQPKGQKQQQSPEKGQGENSPTKQTKGQNQPEKGQKQTQGENQAKGQKQSGQPANRPDQSKQPDKKPEANQRAAQSGEQEMDRHGGQQPAPQKEATDEASSLSTV